MSASASLVALDGTSAAGVSAVVPATEVGEAAPVAGQVLPTRAELATVLPWSGLRRGSTVAVQGSTALLFALLADATEQGSWAAVIGLPGLGMIAASEAGVEVSRLALVPDSGGDPVNVVAALLDGVDLVVVGPTARFPDADARRLSARARHRGGVLLPFRDWPGADVRLDCARARWHGPERGNGSLRGREVTIRASGRGAAARPRSCRLLLPNRSGITAVHDTPASDSPAAQETPSRPTLHSVPG